MAASKTTQIKSQSGQKQALDCCGADMLSCIW